VKKKKRSFLRKILDFYKYAKCPKCKKYQGEDQGAVLINKQTHTEFMNTEEEHYDQEGRYIGSSYRPERVKVKTKRYDRSFRCKSCGHKWSEPEEEEEIT
jgi:ribosomal protein L44E